MRFRDYRTNNLWDYLKRVFNWSKYCCMWCERNIATHILLRQPKDKPGVCDKCWDKLNRRKSGRVKFLIEEKLKPKWQTKNK